MEKKKRKRADGFTEAQRQWILERDHRACVLCGSDEELHVHHLSPWRWSSTVLRWSLERTNLFTNGVTLCATCHTKGQNAVHADIARANSSYKDDKSIYNKVFAARDELCRKEMPYWCIAHDERMVLIAMYNSIEYISKGHYPTPWKQNIDRVLQDQEKMLKDTEEDTILKESLQKDSKEVSRETVRPAIIHKDVESIAKPVQSLSQFLARNKE